MSKEYNDRQNKPLINKGFTMAEYEAEKKLKKQYQQAYKKIK